MDNCVFCNFKAACPWMLFCGHLICQKCAQVCQQPISLHKAEIICFECRARTEFTDLQDLQQLQIVETMMDTSPDQGNQGYQSRLKEALQEGSQTNCCIHHQEYSLYCQTCKALCCIECVHDTNNHKKHHVLSLKQALSVIASENTLFFRKQKNNIKRLEEAIKVCTSNQNFLHNQKRIIQDYVTFETQSLITQLKQKEQEVLDGLDHYIATHLSQVQDSLDAYLSQKNSLSHFKSTAQDKETLLYLFHLQHSLAKQEQVAIPQTLTNNNIIDFSSAKEIASAISKFGQFLKPKPTGKQLQRGNSLSKTKSTQKQPLRQINITNKENKRSQKQFHPTSISRQVTPQKKTPQKPVQIKREKVDVPLDSDILREYDYKELENILPPDLDKFEAITFDEFFSKVPNKVLGLVQANSYKFGWFWSVDSVREGYNRGECYIFTLKNYINSLLGQPMKFQIRYEKQDFCFSVSEECISLGQRFDGRYDLHLDLLHGGECHSAMGNSFSVVEPLEGARILGGREDNWSVESIELYSWK